MIKEMNSLEENSKRCIESYWVTISTLKNMSSMNETLGQIFYCNVLGQYALQLIL